MSFRGGSQQNVIDAGARAVLRVFGYPHALRDLIGGRESDSVDLLGQSVRILLHCLNGQVSVCLVDAHCSPSTDTVAMQEEHDLADMHTFLPGIGNTLSALWANSIDGFEAGGTISDH